MKRIFAIMALLISLPLVQCYPVLKNKEAVFAFNDGNIETALSPTFAYPDVMRGLWDNQFYFGQGSPGSSIATWSILESVLGPQGYRRIGVVIYMAMTGLLGFCAFRFLNHSHFASVAAAILLMLSGWNQTFAMNGLGTRSTCMLWSLLSVAMLEKGFKDKKTLTFLLAGSFLGLAISDNADVGVIFALSCGLFFWLRCIEFNYGYFSGKVWKHVFYFSIYVASSFLLAYQTIDTMVSTQIVGVSQGSNESAEARYAWATQWSIPKAEIWSILAPNYHGVTSRSATAPYWGEIGQTEGWEQHRQGFRNFSLAGYFIGSIPILFIFIFVGLFVKENKRLASDDDRRKIICIFILISLSLLLAWGRHFPLYKLFYALPYMDTIRNPDKWMGPFTLFISWAFALALDFIMINTQSAKPSLWLNKLWKSAFILPGLALAGIILLILNKSNFIRHLENDGYGQAALNCWQVALNANLEMFIVSFASLILMRIYWSSAEKNQRKIWSLMLIILLMAGQMVKAGSFYVAPHIYNEKNADNILTHTLDNNRHDRRIMIIPPQHPILNYWRLSHLLHKGYNIFNPISVSRMPVEEQIFLETIGSNTLKLWQLGSIGYIIAPQEYLPSIQGMDPEAVKSVLSFGAIYHQNGYVPSTNVPLSEKKFCLIEYTNALPLYYFTSGYATFGLSLDDTRRVLSTIEKPAFRPEEQSLIQAEQTLNAGPVSKGEIRIIDTTPRSAELETAASSQGLLIRNMKYHPDWKVTVDGRTVPLYRANYLFQAIFVPAGTHTVRFIWSPSTTSFYIAFVGRILWLALLIFFIIKYIRYARSCSNKKFVNP